MDIKILKKSFKRLKKFSKNLYNDNDYQQFNERCKKILKLYKKSLKSENKWQIKNQIEALTNRVLTLRSEINNIAKNNDISIVKGQRAFANRISSTLFVNHKHKIFDDFFDASKAGIVKLLRKRVQKYKSVKIFSVFVAKFSIKDCVELKYIYSSSKMITRNTHLSKFYSKILKPEIRTNLENFEGQGSGYKLKEIKNLTININMCKPLSVGSYIALPKFIKSKRAVWNPKNTDDKCLLWCLLKNLEPTHPLNKMTSRKVVSNKKQKRAEKVFKKYFRQLKNFTFPLPVKQLKKFEDANNMSINVYIIEKKNEISPLHITENKMKNHTNLLLINKDGNYHYCLINNLSRLVSHQVKKWNARIFICDRCLNYFYSEEKLKFHDGICENINKCRIIMPKEKIIKFKDYSHQLFNPFIVYFDCEAVLIKTVDENIFQEHQIYSIGLYLVNRWDNSKSYYKEFHQGDVVSKFMKELKNIAEFAEKVILQDFLIDKCI